MRMITVLGKGPITKDNAEKLFGIGVSPFACICNIPSNNFSKGKSNGGHIGCHVCSGTCNDTMVNLEANYEKADLKNTVN